jgi:hypothetical protein
MHREMTYNPRKTPGFNEYIIRKVFKDTMKKVVLILLLVILAVIVINGLVINSIGDEIRLALSLLVI